MKTYAPSLSRPLLCLLGMLCFILGGCHGEGVAQTERIEPCTGDGALCDRPQNCSQLDGGDCSYEPDSGASRDATPELDERVSSDTGVPDQGAVTLDGDFSSLDGQVVDGGTDASADDQDNGVPPCLVEGGAGMITRDLPYAGEDARQVLDLYRTTAPGPNPLLIWVHGGGWRGGSKNQVNRRFLSFLQRGYAVASLEYRLSDTPWPVTVIDVKSAVRFLRANAAEFNLDPNAFVAMGSSAGGHLVALLGTSAEHPLFLGADPIHPDVSDGVQAVVNLFGPSDLDEMDRDAMAHGCPENALCHDCEGSPESLLLDCRPSQCGERADEASPVEYANAAAAPMLIIHGMDDCTVPTPQGRRLHEALTAVGAHSELIEVPGAGHNVNACLTAGNTQSMIEFVEREIRGCAAGPGDVPAPPENRQLGECAWRHCPELAAICEMNPVCVALEACFQDCFSNGLDRCINRCLGTVANAEMGSGDHEALFRCARPQGCYGNGR